MIHLCRRLQAVMDLVPPGRVTADIGCDHGYLACSLLLQGAPWVAAVDISEPSLRKARRLAEELSLQERIRLRLGDGLQQLEDEVEVIVIAGLSANTIASILRESAPRARAARCLILQPMQDMEGLRRSITQLGFAIDAEELVYENRRYYPILRAVPGTAAYTRDELDLGPCLLRDMHPLLPPYLLWKMGVIQRAARNLRGPQRLEMDKEIVRLEGIRQTQLQKRAIHG